MNADKRKAPSERRAAHAASRHVKVKKVSVLLAVVLSALCITAVGITAYLFTNTDVISNMFSPAHVTCAVEEQFDGMEKKDVQIRNTGDTDAYIRAALVFALVDEGGNIAETVPVKDKDYKMTLNDTDWVIKSDGYYYCKASVAPGALTPVLITSCTQTERKDGLKLELQIIASAIQSQPENVVKTAWNVTVDNGLIG